MNTLDTLKTAYKKTFTEPRLSGKLLPIPFKEELFTKIDASKTLDEFTQAIGRDEAHIIKRIIEWENQPPLDIPNESKKHKTAIKELEDAISESKFIIDNPLYEELHELLYHHEVKIEKLQKTINFLKNNLK